MIEREQSASPAIWPMEGGKSIIDVVQPCTCKWEKPKELLYDTIQSKSMLKRMRLPYGGVTK